MKLTVRNKKIIAVTIIFLLILFVASDISKIKIDKYNFEQLERVKKILGKKSGKEKYKFRSLSHFNQIYNQNIKPKKKCYYLVSTKYFKDENYGGNEFGYIFGFKLESWTYRILHMKINYAYPRYDLPYEEICFGSYCYDINEYSFINIVSNPCED